MIVSRQEHGSNRNNIREIRSILPLWHWIQERGRVRHHCSVVLNDLISRIVSSVWREWGEGNVLLGEFGGDLGVEFVKELGESLAGGFRYRHGLESGVRDVGQELADVDEANRGGCCWKDQELFKYYVSLASFPF